MTERLLGFGDGIVLGHHTSGRPASSLGHYLGDWPRDVLNDSVCLLVAVTNDSLWLFVLGLGFANPAGDCCDSLVSATDPQGRRRWCLLSPGTVLVTSSYTVGVTWVC